MNDDDTQTGRSYAAARNILRDDVAILLVEVRSLEGQLMKVMHSAPNQVPAVMSQLLEYFYGLFTQTINQLKSEDKEKIENREDVEDENKNKEGIKDFFDDPFVLVKKKDENEQERYSIEPNSTSRRALKFVAVYRKYLNNAGLTDMRTFDTRPSYSYKESL